MKETRRHHYRIYSPIRFFVFVLISVMIAVFSIYAVMGAGKADAATVRTYTQVAVGEDDNLWSIVEQYNPDANISIRDALYDVYEINGITADSIRPGDKIFVPIY